MTAQQAATALAAPVDHSSDACGTRRGYSRGCRCRPCRDGAARYSREKYRAEAYGTWRKQTPIAPYQQKIREWRDQGVTITAISEASGIAEGVLRAIQAGRRTTIQARTADALNAARPVQPLTSRIDATGSHRRIQALATRGWTIADIARRGNVSVSTLHDLAGGQERIYAGTADRIRTVYDDLWDRDAPRSAGATYARRRATEAGWAPPAAWDDDTIDDPRAKPAGIVKPARRENPFRPLDDLVVAEITELHRLGHSDSAIARRLGKSASAIQKVRNRYDIRRAS